MNKLGFLFVSLSPILFYSCTKTEPLEPLPKNKILEYKVINAADTLYGVINNIENTIIVYVPFYYGLSVIDPEISLEAGAKINEEILPVNIKDSTVTYAVSGSDGSSRTYKLRIIQQNPDRDDLTINFGWGSIITVYPNDFFPGIFGNFLTTNIQLTTLELVSEKNGNVINIPVADGVIRTNATEYSINNLFFPIVDTGIYKIRFSLFGYSFISPFPINAQYRQPDISVTSSEKVVSHGGELSFPAINPLFGLIKAEIVIDGTKYELPIKSYTTGNVTISIPDDLPLGSHPGSTISFEFESWNTVNKRIWLTVQE